VAELVNRLSFKFGGFDPWHYRIVNLFIHMLAGIVLFALTYSIGVGQKIDAFYKKHAFWISSFVSVFFLLHPVQTQTVSYVAQARLEGLATLFIFLSLLLLHACFLATTRTRACLWFGLALFIAFLACGVKEIAIILPALAFLIDLVFIAEFDLQKLLKERFVYHLIFFSTVFFMTASFMGFGKVWDVFSFQSSMPNNRGNVLTPNPFTRISPFSYFISEFKVIVHYFAIFFFPSSMSVEYEFGLAQNFLQADVILPLVAIVLGLLMVAISFYYRKFVALSFGFLWFFVSLLPRSSVIPSPELACDYKTYVASAGLFLSLSILLMGFVLVIVEGLSAYFGQVETGVLKRDGFSFSSYSSLFSTCMVFAISLGFLSEKRNQVWGSTISFWQDVVNKCPKKPRARNNLGVAYSEANLFQEALVHYKKAIELDSFYPDPLSNMAVAFSMLGMDENAITALERAVRMVPRYPEARNNLAALLIKNKQYDRAKEELAVALELRPFYGKASFNLGRLYLEEGDNEKGWQCFKQATEGDLDTFEGFFTLGQLSMTLGKHDEAIRAFQACVDKGVKKDVVFFHLANSHYLAGNLSEAEKIYCSLADKHPDDARFVYNLGEALFAQKRYEEAGNCFSDTLLKTNQYPSAAIRLSLCLEKSQGVLGAIVGLEEVLKVASFKEEDYEMVKNELGRLRLQQKIAEGNGTINMKDLQEAFQV
jgi:tetratricopeptide (TPR) repeat protein